MRSLLYTILLLAGCADTLEPGSLITRSRVLGARVEVDGDALRSWPAPGETARLTWIVAAPDAPPPLAWAFAACAATPDGLGCAGDPFATDRGAGTVPATALAIPGAPALGDATAARVFGVICADGTPELDNPVPSCAGGAPTQTDVALTVPLALGHAPNHNPTLGTDAIRLDGDAWTALDPAAEPPMTGCAAQAGGATLPLRHATKTAAHVAVALGETDRELVTITSADGTTTNSRETMQVSHFATAGKLARQFSVIEGDDPTTTPAIDVEWTPLADQAPPPPADGLRVRFTFVARDGRGGLDATTRVACLVP